MDSRAELSSLHYPFLSEVVLFQVFFVPFVLSAILFWEWFRLKSGTLSHKWHQVLEGLVHICNLHFFEKLLSISSCFWYSVFWSLQATIPEHCSVWSQSFTALGKWICCSACLLWCMLLDRIVAHGDRGILYLCTSSRSGKTDKTLMFQTKLWSSARCTCTDQPTEWE